MFGCVWPMFLNFANWFPYIQYSHPYPSLSILIHPYSSFSNFANELPQFHTKSRGCSRERSICRSSAAIWSTQQVVDQTTLPPSCLPKSPRNRALEGRNSIVPAHSCSHDLRFQVTSLKLHGLLSLQNKSEWVKLTYFQIMYVHAFSRGSNPPKIQEGTQLQLSAIQMC